VLPTASSPRALTPSHDAPAAAPAPTDPSLAGPASVDAAEQSPPDTPPPAPSPIDVPRDTTPTFELEMLVSGAVLFGLLQLPSALGALVAHYEPHLGLFGIFIAAGVGMLGRAAIYALIACFVLHLGLRAYWVALVGVHSVFPGGVRWDRMKESGPISRSVLQERIRPLPHAITRFDNAASLVFATGFVLAMGTASGMLVLLFAALVVWALAAAGASRPEILVLAVVIPIGLAYMALPIVDYKFGARLTGRAERMLRRGVRFILGTQPASLSALQSVLSTNVDKRVAYGVLFVGVFAATGGSMLSIADDTVPGASQYEFFAGAAAGKAVEARFYDSLRGEEASDRAPSIQSDVITGPYVRLFVPYMPLRHNAAFARDCRGLPAGEAAAEDSDAGRAAADAILGCALKVHRPMLDGRPLDAHGFRFFVNPRTNRRGFLMLVPTAGLTPGEHRITVWPARANGRPAPKTPYTIPFWR
jgi:hypothetical protein